MSARGRGVALARWPVVCTWHLCCAAWPCDCNNLTLPRPTPSAGGAWLTQAVLLLLGSISASMPLIATFFTGVIAAWLGAVKRCACRGDQPAAGIAVAVRDWQQYMMAWLPCLPALHVALLNRLLLPTLPSFPLQPGQAAARV